MHQSIEAEREALRRVVLIADGRWNVIAITDGQGDGIRLARPLAAGTSLSDLLHPDDLEVLAHNAGWCRTHVGREVVLHLRYARAPEWWFPLLTRVRASGEDNITLAIELDSAVAARAAEMQMRQVVDGSQQGIVVLTLEKPLYINSGLARLLGYDSVDELVDSGNFMTRENIHPDDFPKVVEHMRKRLSGEEKFSQYELRVKRRDGSYLWVETMASLVVWDGKPASLSWLIDIEARRHAQEELIRSRESAERASRVKSEFLASMSHELRTPLNAIIGFSEMISTAMLGSLNPRYAEYASDIHKSGEHLLDLINDILDLSKLEAGKLALKEGVVDIDAVVRSAVELVRSQSGKKQLVVDENIASSLPCVRGDARALKQVMLNFLSNAVKFTPEGGRIAAGARIVPAGIELFVSDTGVGMTEEEIAVAMEPFGQVDSLLTRDRAGTGLGLPISLSLMRLHGGDVRISSAREKGTTLVALLPLARIIGRAA